LKVKFKVLPGGQAPAKAGAAYDLFARLDSPIEVRSAMLVPLGVALDIPDGYGVIVKARSSGPAKRGFEAHVGLVDPGFNGREVCAIIEPLQGAAVVIQPGERIAQMWVQRMDIELEETQDDIPLGDKAGFGSTGRGGRPEGRG
jgi:dUTP pyrophosphatase